ncbi:MAG: arylsulfotransferase family protein [Planctomycetes bacterium]|nr:arylsulfotransferase family protein [Planctomycetota bacterium]
MHRLPAVRLAPLLLIVAACSCSDDGAPGTTSGGATSSQKVDDIRSLGYTGVVDDPSDDKREGVILNDVARVAPGYNLTSVSKFCTADLFDNAGKLVHQWKDPNGRAWDHAELLEGGDLIVVGSDRGDRKYAGALCEDHYVERFDFDGHSKWKLPSRAHHEIQPMWGGNFMTLTASQRKLPAVDADHDIIDNVFTVISADGKVVEEHSLYDLFSKPESKFVFQRVAPNPNKQFPIIDYFHTNSIEFVTDAALYGTHPIFAPKNILVCMRHQDSIAVVDWERKVVIWQWGHGELSGPHDARVLANGHILVYDNGIERSWTRVVEMDPATGKIVWTYSDPDKKKFFSVSQGGSQRLANGNTLVANSNGGRAFEVTADGAKVWEYLVPHFTDKGQRAEIYRIRRYPVEFVEKLLAAHAPPK